MKTTTGLAFAWAILAMLTTTTAHAQSALPSPARDTAPIDESAARALEAPIAEEGVFTGRRALELGDTHALTLDASMMAYGLGGTAVSIEMGGTLSYVVRWD